MADVNATETGVWSVGGYNNEITVNPTINLSSYAVGQTVGGSITFSVFRTIGQPSGIIDNFWVASKGGATGPLTIYIFCKPLAASTNTDHASFVFGNSDISSLVTTPFVLSPAIIGSGTTASFAQANLAISTKNLENNPNTNLYVIAVETTSAQTYLTTTDLIFGMNIRAD